MKNAAKSIVPTINDWRQLLFIVSLKSNHKNAFSSRAKLRNMKVKPEIMTAMPINGSIDK
jgi:hypothetical protein